MSRSLSKNNLMQHLEWCAARAITLDYRHDRIEAHKTMVKQYFMPLDEPETAQRSQTHNVALRKINSARHEWRFGSERQRLAALGFLGLTPPGIRGMSAEFRPVLTALDVPANPTSAAANSSSDDGSGTAAGAYTPLSAPLGYVKLQVSAESGKVRA
jgi:hypothetical protein